GKPQESLPIFKKAQNIYEKELDPGDSRLGGLYNNMALTLVDLQKYDEAYIYYNKAVEVNAQNQHGELETAITYLNIANALEAQKGLELAEKEISDLIEKAYSLLDSKDLPRNGYYAFVCEKCAPTFGYYGYFLYENELKERAKRIYERD
ncbi:MAG: tetratricopeptide repeat protein, partial [Clostridia bacterium]|nr:tetratricopeptide repeat protein [Clostridia bacterium]